MMRFSQIYLERGAPTRDSTRLRNRLAAFYTELRREVSMHVTNVDGQFAMTIEKELGILVPSSAYRKQPEELFRNGELRDVLDSITLLYRLLDFGNLRKDWREFVERVLHEENVGYVIDEKCIVHYHVDQEFEFNRVATVATLGRAAFASAAAAHEDSYRHLNSDPQDTKAAVRSIFECIEILAKQLVPEAQNINRWQCEKGKLREKCLETVFDDTEKKVVAGLLDSLGDWVDALHNYRHGQADVVAVTPSEELAIYIISTGSAHARQLAQFSTKLGVT